MNSFLKEAYKYLVTKIENSLKNVDAEVMNRCLELLDNGKEYKRITIDGAGRSLQSALLLANELENTYGFRVNQVSNANLRPLRKGDVFIVNSRSGGGKAYEHAKFAEEKGLDIIYITGNADLVDDFENVILIKGDINHQEHFAPLGTEFEQASAVLCSCMGYSYLEFDKRNVFYESCKQAISGFQDNLKVLEQQGATIQNFTELINDYLTPENNNVVYFMGVGINDIISRVVAIRYGHLHKENSKDIHVVYEGHWRSRQRDDLAVLLSGSGETDQIIRYAWQAGDLGMKLFGITSFKESNLARSIRWYRKSEGNLVIQGRPKMLSYYNTSLRKINERYFPQFELNTYLTLDALLSLIAKQNGITGEDMKKTHRDKELE